MDRRRLGIPPNQKRTSEAVTIDEAEQRLKALGFVHDNDHDLWIFPQWALNYLLPPNEILSWKRVLVQAQDFKITKAAIMPIRPKDMPFLESVIEWLEFQLGQTLLTKQDVNELVIETDKRRTHPTGKHPLQRLDEILDSNEQQKT